MNWQDRLDQLVMDKELETAIKLMRKVVEENPNDSWTYIQAIYLFHNILLEEDYPEVKQDDLILLLQDFFNKSKEKFSEDPEYLFFIGKILHIAEWYFGLDDNKLAFFFQEKAMKKEPGNLLYEWAYRLSCAGDPVEGYLANQLIDGGSEKVDWLKSKRFPGRYILEHLQMSKERYLKNH